MEAQAVTAENPFDSARQTFETLIGKLQSAKTQALSHGEVEVLVQGDGREVLRQLFQAHLDVRGLGDVGDVVVGADDVARTRRRVSARRLMSIFGLVLVTRLLYAPRDGGAPALAPMDASPT